MTITGRFPVLERAAAKIASRLGVRCAEMHALESSEIASRLKIKYRELANLDLFNGHRPTTIH
jgi:RNA polymerase subunit RPABC4/transcription elongation factor Spt4